LAGEAVYSWISPLVLSARTAFQAFQSGELPAGPEKDVVQRGFVAAAPSMERGRTEAKESFMLDVVVSTVSMEASWDRRPKGLLEGIKRCVAKWNHP
jgi:hypothetical protein